MGGEEELNVIILVYCWRHRPVTEVEWYNNNRGECLKMHWNYYVDDDDDDDDEDTYYVYLM